MRLLLPSFTIFFPSYYPIPYVCDLIARKKSRDIWGTQLIPLLLPIFSQLLQLAEEDIANYGLSCGQPVHFLTSIEEERQPQIAEIDTFHRIRRRHQFCSCGLA